jgi:signal transduction histidine kinase
MGAQAHAPDGDALPGILARARDTCGATALGLVVDGRTLAIAGEAGPIAHAVDAVAPGVDLHRWGGSPVSEPLALQILVVALRGMAASVSAAEADRAATAAFLGVAAHEVKTPLTVVLGSLRLLQQHSDALEAEQRDVMLQMATRRTRDVTRLVDGVLSTARRRLTRSAGRSDLASVVKDAIAGVEYGKTIDVRPLPDVVLALDGPTAQAIIGSLVDEAVTRGDAGTVEAALVDAGVTVTIRNVDMDAENLRDDPRYEPAEGDDDEHPATSALHLAGMLARGAGASLSGGLAGDAVLVDVTLPVAR